MNDKQKILTHLMLPAFIFVGVNGFTPPGEGGPSTLNGWFAVGAIYVALSFLLSRQGSDHASGRWSCNMRTSTHRHFRPS